MQINVVKYRLFFFIGKRHIAIINNALDVRKLFCIRFINYSGHGIHDLTEPLKARHTLLKLLREFHKNIDGVDENIDVEGVDCKILTGHLPLSNKVPSGHENRYKHHSFKEIVAGEKHRHLSVVGLLGIEERCVGAVKFLFLDILSRKGFNDPDASQSVLKG